MNLCIVVLVYSLEFLEYLFLQLFSRFLLWSLCTNEYHPCVFARCLGGLVLYSFKSLSYLLSHPLCLKPLILIATPSSNLVKMNFLHSLSLPSLSLSPFSSSDGHVRRRSSSSKSSWVSRIPPSPWFRRLPSWCNPWLLRPPISIFV